MPTIDVILIVVAALVSLIGVALSYWDDIGIWWFEFQYGKMSPEMAMEMARWYVENICLNKAQERHNIHMACVYEMYATRIIERAQRRAK